MKHLYKLSAIGALLLGLGLSPVLAQEGVRLGPGPATAPDASAALDIVAGAQKKGLLIPRMTAAERGAITTPAQGLIVYQTDGTGTGFWYNQGSSTTPKWLRLTDADGVSYDPTTGLQVGPGPVQASTSATAGTQTGNFFWPYRGDVADGRVLMLYQASDLISAGVVPGQLSALQFNVLSKASTQPFQNFTIQLGQTAATVAGTTFQNGLTTVFTGNVTTAVGWNTHTFQTPFTWNGTSNLYVQICFDNSTASAVDPIAAFVPAYQSYVRAADNTGPGCSLTTPGLASGNILPVTRFQQFGAYTLPPVAGQAGQVLTQQANGSVTFQDPQWKQVGTSLYPSTLTSNVGIGTETPLAKLDIQGGADSNGANDPQALALQWRNGGYRHWLRTRHNAGLGGGGNALDFFVNNSNTAAGSSAPTVGTQHVLTLDNYSGARVGIGTTAPVSMLSNTTTNIVGADGIGINQPSLTWVNGTQGYAGAFYNSNTSPVGHNGLAVKVASNATSTAALDVSQGTDQSTPGASLLRVRGDGYVGLGTATPRERLHIASGGADWYFHSGGAPFLGFNVYYDNATGRVRYGKAGLPAVGIQETVAGDLDIATAVTNPGAANAEVNGTGSLAASTRLRVANNGNIGIGTLTPAAKLDVVGDVRIPAANDYTYAAAKTKSVMLSASDFRAENGTTSGTYFSSSDEFHPTVASGTPVYRAPLHLPQGAIITGITLYSFDNVPQNITAELFSYAVSTNFTTRTVHTTVTSGNGHSVVASPVLNVAVDNENLTYTVRATFGLGNNNSLTIKSVKVTYTVTKAD